jgi:glucokinase
MSPSASPLPYPDGPRLLADIGGTKARFALEVAPGQCMGQSVVPCQSYPSLQQAIGDYLARPESRAQGGERVRHVAIAMPNPVDGDAVRMTNHDWAFSIEAMRREFGWHTLLVVNDFTALAMALPYLPAAQKRQIGGGVAREHGVIGLIGAGTGLGVSGMIPLEDRWFALGSEGGHTSFSPRDAREIAVLQYAMRHYSHVSAERLLSGKGLELIYLALAELTQQSVAPLSAADISSRALSGESGLCREVLDCFCAILGTVAADVALTLGASGGIYLGSSIVPRFGDYFDASPFRQRFEDKGRFGPYLAQIPTFLITGDNPVLPGLSALLADRLNNKSASAPILETIDAARARLSPSEQRVANLVLQDPRAVLSSPIVEIARMAEVSQPTVMRFCRSLNLQGLAEFKLKLAAGLTGTIALSHSQIKYSDSTAEVSEKVLANSAYAAMALRDTINAQALGQAIDLLQQASQVEILCIGAARLVAEDALQKLLHLGIRTSYFPDMDNQLMSASLLRKSDVALAISRSGQPEAVLACARAAKQAGASLIAITPGNSPLARLADVALHINHEEGDLQYIPMVVRLLQLIVIDILAIGLAKDRKQELTSPGELEDGREARKARKLGTHLE